MNLEIRPIRDDEVEQAEAITGYAFNASDRANLQERVERFRRFYSTDWTLAAFEDGGEMTTYMQVLPFVMRINGRGIPFGAVSPVAASPVHRRKGHTGALLRESLRVMRERGQPLSGLYTPHPAFYRRYGWEIASEFRIYSFKPKDLGLTVRPSEPGRFRQLEAQDWPQLDAVYRRHGVLRNGVLHRSEPWWQNAVLNASGNPPADAVLWEDGAGRAQGYMVLRQGFSDGGKLRADELVSLTSDAYLNLLLYLCRHDIHSEIILRCGVEDLFLNVIEDADRVTMRQEYGVLLRICDFERAIAMRPPVDPHEAMEFTIAVRDTDAPWNDGVWRVGNADGRSFAERTDAAPQLSASTTVLGPIFNGYLRPSRAGVSGLISVEDQSAVLQADRFFATHHAPHFRDVF
jgi:predicted acetyltransferase